MNALLLSRYGPPGASSRIRMYQYVPWLRRAGIHVTAMPFFEDDYLERRYASAPQPLPSLARAVWRRLRALLTSRRFDLTWIEYELFPWAPGIAESVLALAGIPTIVEYDDAVFTDTIGIRRGWCGRC